MGQIYVRGWSRISEFEVGVGCQWFACTTCLARRRPVKDRLLFELKPFPGRGFLCTCREMHDKNGDNMECLQLSTILCFSFGQSFKQKDNFTLMYIW